MTVVTENTGFATFALYNALKLHFTSNSYNYFKYHGKTNVTQDTFLKRKDKYSFYKVSRKYSLAESRDFMVANFVYGNNTWVGDMMGPDGESAYKKWQKISESLTYRFENDIIYLFDKYSPKEMMSVSSGSYPKLLSETMEESINLETFVIMNDIANFFEGFSKKIDDDIIWPNLRMKCEKYSPFINYDSVKFKNIMKDAIKSCINIE